MCVCDLHGAIRALVCKTELVAQVMNTDSYYNVGKFYTTTRHIICLISTLNIVQNRHTSVSHDTMAYS